MAGNAKRRCSKNDFCDSAFFCSSLIVCLIYKISPARKHQSVFRHNSTPASIHGSPVLQVWYSHTWQGVYYQTSIREWKYSQIARYRCNPRLSFQHACVGVVIMLWHGIRNAGIRSLKSSRTVYFMALIFARLKTWIVNF